MPEEVAQRSLNLQEGEKATSLMLYTADRLIWGELVTKETIRVSTWMCTQTVGGFIRLYEAQMWNFRAAAGAKPQRFNEVFIPAEQMIAFHLRPPAREPLDYDPNEPNRKMEPVTALIGPFRLRGSLRMSTQTTLDRFLDALKGTFIALYEVKITQQEETESAAMHVPCVFLRGNMVSFVPEVR